MTENDRRCISVEEEKSNDLLFWQDETTLEREFFKLHIHLHPGHQYPKTVVDGFNGHY